MNDLYYPLLLMSAAASILYLLLRLLSKWTQHYFTATWHYYSHVFLYTLFFIPYFKLISWLNPKMLGIVPNTVESPIDAPIEQASRELPESTVVSDASHLITAEQMSNEPSGFLFNLWNVIPYVMAAGTIVFLTAALIQNIKIHRRIFALCELTEDPDILRELSASKKKLGVSKEIPVYLSPYISTPFLYGLLKPRIVLPAAMAFTAEEYRQIFLHELTHDRRRDVWVKCLLLCANALHWFNPLAYMARRDVDRYCELSCDEQIVQPMNMAERRQYCELLLHVLWKAADQRAKLYSAFSDKRKHLERRIRMILKTDGAKRKKYVRLFATMATLLLMIFGTSAVYGAMSAHDAPLKSDQVVFNQNGCALVSDKVQNIGPVAVEQLTASIESFDTYDEIKPGECENLGGSTLHKGDVISLKYAYTGGDLKVYLLEYDAQTLEDGRLMDSGSNYTIPEDGHYYFILQNGSQTESSEEVEMSVRYQIDS
ncbi:hypothetical protein PACILC2_55560 [Paenibacillus cisolokensis]|uniref:Peptidase M56 domain-containing protein n=1 Tax=Paenibacillus cisolokensis TaxID=1658519 RepID=A0ABQ4NFH2_9BACL|nr:M56 family metallopeptidase [Paenibacillus cisolokensis]GIQ66988.1 hypothetical protein PACILC2_55560 [Paenibacillus cisolokensis]